MKRDRHTSRPRSLLGRLWVLAAIAVTLPGCLTDGSIPVGGGGGNGVLRGVVAFAEDPDRPFPNAQVTVRSAGGFVSRGTTDLSGQFEFPNVPDGPLEVTFDGSPPGVYLPVRIVARGQYASYATIAVALEPAHLARPDVTAVRITPREVLTTVGRTVQFQAAITGGNPRRKVPTWVVEGGIGSITPRGAFRALHAGTGTLRAIAAGGVSDSISITVTTP